MKAVRIIAVVAAANLTACQGIDAGPESDRPDLNRYVSMGSSLSMGFASGGLTADGQRAAWPAQLAARAGVDFGLPLIDAPGCPPPLVTPLGNLRRADNSIFGTPTTCASSSAGVSLPEQNVSISGATAEHAVALTPLNNAKDPLYSRVLAGNQTQLRAVEAMNPTFVSVEFGANEVLPAMSGLVSDASAGGFLSSFTQIANELRQRTSAKVLMALLPSDVRKFPAIRTGPEVASQRAAFATRNVSVNANCDASANYVTLIGKILPALVTGAARAATGLGPADLSCSDIAGQRDGILTPGDITTLNAAVKLINDIITDRANTNNYALFSLGSLYDTVKDGVPFDLNAILTSTTPFGTLMSHDGIHPSPAGHAILASAAQAGIVAKYGDLVED
jgi:hypothetical protein